MGKLFEAASGCFENTAELRVRFRKGRESRVRGRALHELSRVANDTLRTSAPFQSMVLWALMAVHLTTDRRMEKRMEKLLAVAISWFASGEAFRGKARAVPRCFRHHKSGRWPDARKTWQPRHPDEDLLVTQPRCTLS